MQNYVFLNTFLTVTYKKLNTSCFTDGKTNFKQALK